MWGRQRTCLTSKLLFRRLSTVNRRQRHIEDEGHWSYASEWWGTDSDCHTNTVFRAVSDKGNGVVSVLAYPCSRPSAIYWPSTERWLQQRYAELLPERNCEEQFRVLGYQWRVLRFNGNTRQSTVKVLVASNASDSDSVYLMQQGHCLAVPYLKSMLSAGLASLASCNFHLQKVLNGSQSMRVLCIGHGGGSLPLFLASFIQGAAIDIVEIDPLVIRTSIQAMGFPPFSVASAIGQHAVAKPDIIDDVLWRGIHERLFLYESDAEKFIIETTGVYDIVFIDAYDGEDIFPHKLWDPQSPFLEALGKRLHPDHGTVVVNLHSSGDISSPDGSVSSVLQPFLPNEKYVSKVCRSYKDVLTGNGSVCAFTLSVPWLCNTTFVISRGFLANGGRLDSELVFNTLYNKSLEIDTALDMPLSCLEYIKRGFTLV